MCPGLPGSETESREGVASRKDCCIGFCGQRNPCFKTGASSKWGSDFNAVSSLRRLRQ